MNPLLQILKETDLWLLGLAALVAIGLFINSRKK